MTNVRISRYGPSKSKRQGHIDFVYDTSVQFSMLALKDCKLFGKKMSMAPQHDMSSSAALHRALVKGPSQNSSTDVICLDDEILDIPESKSSNSSTRKNTNQESSSRSSRSEKTNSSNKNPRQTSNSNNSKNSGNNSRTSSRNSSKSNNNNGREWSGWQEVIEVID